MLNTFGTLVRNKEQHYDIRTILNQNTMEIDYLFKNSRNSLEKMTVIEAERQIALENLRKLTQELQDKRLEYNNKSKLNYFTK